MVSNSRGIVALKELRPYLRLLEAYDGDHFRQSDRDSILRSGFYAFCTTVMILSTFATNVLATWDLFDNGNDVKSIAIALPTLLGFLQLGVTFITLTMQSRALKGIIEQLQSLIDQREFFIYFWDIFFYRARIKCYGADFEQFRSVYWGLLVLFLFLTPSNRMYKLKAISSNLSECGKQTCAIHHHFIQTSMCCSCCHVFIIGVVSYIICHLWLSTAVVMAIAY